jgi:hypothetical protein
LTLSFLAISVTLVPALGLQEDIYIVLLQIFLEKSIHIGTDDASNAKDNGELRGTGFFDCGLWILDCGLEGMEYGIIRLQIAGFALRGAGFFDCGLRVSRCAVRGSSIADCGFWISDC